MSPQVPVDCTTIFLTRQETNPSFSLPTHHTHTKPHVTTHSCLATIFYPLATGPSHTATTNPHVQPPPAKQPHSHATQSFSLNTFNSLCRKIFPSLTSIFSFSIFANAKVSRMNSYANHNPHQNCQLLFELFSFSL